jgi:hypothetical protein
MGPNGCNDGDDDGDGDDDDDDDHHHHQYSDMLGLFDCIFENQKMYVLCIVS